MKLRLLIVLIISCLSSKASSIDSILFSIDGQYLLLRDFILDKLENGCSVENYSLFERGKEYEDEEIVIYGDSAYSFTNDETKPIFKTEGYSTFKHIKNRYLLKNFIATYKLTLKSYHCEDQLKLEVDTIKIYTNKENSEYPVYYDLAMKVSVCSNMVRVDTVSTNISQDFSKFFDCKLYFSSDNKFFFLDGSLTVEEEEKSGYFLQQMEGIFLLGKNNL